MILKSVRSVVVVLMMFIGFTSCVSNGTKATSKDSKEAILLVTFGSSYKGPEATFKNIEEEFVKAYPDVEIQWAFTSRIIRKILHKRGVGPYKGVNAPEDALLKLKKEGYQRIAVQSLHIIPGTEYNDLKGKVEAFQQANPQLTLSLGTPLMDTDKDMNQLADILVHKFDKNDQTVVMMGHGTVHAANDRYVRIGNIFRKEHPSFIVGTVEAKPDIENVVEEVAKLSSKNILLMPLMSVAGDHATNDMAGDEEDSWKTVLEKNNYAVSPLLQGLCDYDEVVDIFVQHLKASMKDDQKKCCHH
ncbi:sirohydrochlorin cobaltochelatase [Halosquirtibacter xylanolyticus]|uniref:sirohydrochlorin cobaltochelatase n=1 Tax=Halosquirtibacter xylanolyticus TaxID=3374599 RepID=UPI003748B0B7|nr:sirohydrochlorin cobaltochelatase [Prolixibacteraceae bacterium]